MKLRDICVSPASLLEDDASDLLQAMFARVVPTSTFNERMFSRLTEWSKGKERGPRPRLSTIASKHCSHMFQRRVQ